MHSLFKRINRTLPCRRPATSDFIHVYSYFEKGCRKKKNIKKHATRPKGGLGIHWNFAYWPGGNLQVCVFARGKFVFPLKGLYL